MKSIIFTYDPELSKKCSQFTVVLQSAEKADDRWQINAKGLLRHEGDLNYLANHSLDKFRFKSAVESEMAFRQLETRELKAPGRFVILRIHPNILADFIKRCQNQGILTDKNGSVTRFKIFENVIPTLVLENNRFELYLEEHPFFKNDFVSRFIPITVVCQNDIYQLAGNIPYAFIKEIPTGKTMPENNREAVLMKYINIPDKIRIHTPEKKKVAKDTDIRTMLNFDMALRKAQLEFIYDGIAIKDTDIRAVVFDVDKNIEVTRNLESENKFREDLKQAGFFLRPKEAYNWFLSSRSLSAVYPDLINKGFELRVNHRYLNLPKAVKWRITSDKDYLYVGGTVISGKFEMQSDEMFTAFYRHQSFFEQPDGTYGLISDEIKRLLFNLSNVGELDKNTLKFKKSEFSYLDRQFDHDTNLDIDTAFAALKTFSENFDGIKRYPVPESLKAVLRDYQVLGYNWLRTLKELGLNGILADDMGLGKTLQVLSLIKSLMDENRLDHPTLLVVPKTLMFNWEEEIHKFTPELFYRVCVGLPDIDPNTVQKHRMIITSYGLVRQHVDAFCKIHWSYLILDEAQAVKNPSAMISKAIKRIPCDHRLSITGTPVENSALDLWSQFDFLMPGFLYGLKKFKQKYNNNKDQLNELRIKTKLYILRRLKSQVAGELPDKTEITLLCDFTKDQKSAYDKALAHARQVIHDRENGHVMDILQLILRLRQISCHPALAVKPVKRLSTSGKLAMVLDKGLEILSEGHKMLIFSQFTQHLQLVKNAFLHHKIPCFYLDGKTPNREAVVHQFKSFDGPCPFFISLKTGGTGLNLSESNYVFLLDPWWNPAVENQAIDRCHRIGQKRPVFVYRFITKNSIEEKVRDLKQIKQEIESTVIDVSFPEYAAKEHVPVDQETLKALILN